MEPRIFSLSFRYFIIFLIIVKVINKTIERNKNKTVYIILNSFIDMMMTYLFVFQLPIFL